MSHTSGNEAKPKVCIAQDLKTWNQKRLELTIGPPSLFYTHTHRVLFRSSSSV